MGAPIAAFASAHPQHLAGCSAGTCYGSPISNGEGVCCQFTTVQTTGGPVNRVDGYTQAFANGTSVGEAKAAVLAMMPRDTKTTAFFIQRDSLGATCAFWNTKSATLGKWFSGPKVGDAKGVMGIELSTVDASDNAVYKPSDVTAAVIDLAPVDHGTNC